MIDWESINVRKEYPEVLGEIIKECGLSRYCIARETLRMLNKLTREMEKDLDIIDRLAYIRDRLEDTLTFIEMMMKITREVD